MRRKSRRKSKIKRKSRRKSKIKRKSRRKSKIKRKSRRKSKIKRKSIDLFLEKKEIEFGNIPIYSDEGTIFTKGIIDCLVVTLQKFNNNSDLIGVIGGHFVTGIEHKTVEPMWSNKEQNFTNYGKDFINTIIKYAEDKNFNEKNTDLVVYYNPRLDGKKHKDTDNIFENIKKILKKYYYYSSLTATNNTWYSDRIKK